MKRFYTFVTTEKDAGGYHIKLDNRPVKTPSGQMLLAPDQGMAEAIQQEWAAQDTEIVPDSMPLTQLLNTALDQVSMARQGMSEAVLKYLDTDLLCYHAGAEPEGQAEAQQKLWQPWLDWFAGRFDHALLTTDGLAALSQPDGAHRAVRTYVENLDDHRFTILQLIVPMTGSLVLGLAFVEGQITPAQVYAAAHVEEDFKAQIYNEAFYGPDPAQDKKNEALKRDLNAAAAYLAFLS